MAKNYYKGDKDLYLKEWSGIHYSASVPIRDFVGRKYQYGLSRAIIVSNVKEWDCPPPPQIRHRPSTVKKSVSV